PDSARCEDACVAGDTWIARVDAAGLGARVPLVDRVVILHARIGAAPRGVGDLIPQLAGLHFLQYLARFDAAGQLPVGVFLDRFEKAIGDAHGVVGVLPADGVIRFAVEIV